MCNNVRLDSAADGSAAGALPVQRVNHQTQFGRGGSWVVLLQALSLSLCFSSSTTIATAAHRCENLVQRPPTVDTASVDRLTITSPLTIVLVIK